MNELITIVVPIYNVEDYLVRCIESILSQTYRNIEIILVDDESPDNCGEICDYYAKLDERINVIHKKNGGLSDARNVGIETAHGRYITFLDSDDWIHDEYIKMLYSLMIEKKSDIVICNFIKTSSELGSSPSGTFTEKKYEYSNIEAMEQLFGEFYLQMVVAWGKLYKIELFKNIRFPVGRIHEDEFTTYKLLFSADKIVFYDKPLLYYWQREDSIIGSGFKLKHRLDYLDALTERALFLQEIKLEKLSNKIYKSVFAIFLTTFLEINQMGEKREVLVKFKKVASDLKKSRLFGMYIFYRSYLTFPNITIWIYKLYKA